MILGLDHAVVGKLTTFNYYYHNHVFPSKYFNSNTQSTMMKNFKDKEKFFCECKFSFV